jgi:HK97 family phage major capsid protein
MKKSTELRQNRATLFEGMKALLDAAAAENRDLSAEEQASFDRMDSELEGFTAQIEREERMEEHRRTVDSDPASDPTPAPTPDPAEQYRAAFRAYLRGGPQGLAPDEIRALEATKSDLGGFLVAPQAFVTELIKAIDDEVHIRPLATVQTLERAESLGVPALDTDPSDPDWTTELATGSEDTAMKFGKRELTPHPLAKRIKVSQKLLRQASTDVEALVRARLAYKFGLAQEKAFLTGTGVNQPLGVFTASAQGISTGRDATVGSTTDVTADGLIDTKYTLKAAYWRRARWMFHRDAIKRIRKLKDAGNNNYVWQPGLASGQPDTILDVPYLVSEFAPNTFTTGKYVAIIGDFSFYWIVDALDLAVQRLVELYAEANQVGFIGRYEGDGMPVLEEAFVRGKLA